MQERNNLLRQEYLLRQIPDEVLSPDIKAAFMQAESPKEKLMVLGITEDRTREGCCSIGMLNTDENRERIVTAVLMQVSQETSPSMALTNINHLNIHQIHAFVMGVTPAQMQDHFWGSDSSGLRDNGSTTVDFLRKAIENGVAPDEAMNKIKGLKFDEIIAVGLGVSREQLEGHDWSQTNGYKTKNFLWSEIGKNIAPDIAMSKIRGLVGYEIDAVTAGLRREQLAGHQWNSTPGAYFSGVGHITLEYLAMRPEGTDIGWDFGKIKGLSRTEIRQKIEERTQGNYMTAGAIHGMLPRIPMDLTMEIAPYLIGTRHQVVDHFTILPDGTGISHMRNKTEDEVFENGKNIAMTNKAARAGAQRFKPEPGKTMAQKLAAERAARGAGNNIEI